MKNSNFGFDEPTKVIRRADVPEETVYALTFGEAVANFFRSRFSKQGLKRFLKNSFPHKGDSKGEIIRKIIMDVSFVLLMAGLAYMVFYYASYRTRITNLKNWEVAIENIKEEEMEEYEIKKLWDDIKEEYPDVEFPEGMSLKFASLYAVNQDTVGILKISEKELWMPLLQTDISPNYYLYKDLYGEYNRYGNPYVDYRCNMGKDSLSKNTIIYGHNTHDKLGFNKLTSYMTLEGYKEAPVISMETLYEKTEWKVFGVMLTNSTSAADRGHLFRYLVVNFASTGEFNTLLSGIYERSMIRTDVDVNSNDKILTLYTCYQDIFEGGRLVIFARQVRDGESSEVDTSKAYFNYNARYPQAYYDELGLTNPYEGSTTPNYYETDADGSTIILYDPVDPPTEENDSSLPEGSAGEGNEEPSATQSPGEDEPEEDTPGEENTDEVSSGEGDAGENESEETPSEEKPSEKPSEKPEEKPSEEKPSEKPSEKPEDKPADKPVEGEPSSEKPSSSEEPSSAASEDKNKGESEAAPENSGGNGGENAAA